MEERLLVYLHVPKAGGSTLTNILKRQYPSSYFQIDEEKTLEEFVSLHGSEKKRFKVLLTGHMHFGFHESIPAPYTYITMLREPVNRVISHYHFAKRSPEHYMYESIKSKAMTLYDYVECGQCTEVNNGQTRILTNRAMLCAPFGECTTEMLDTARKNLDEYFPIVGLTEKFDESLMLFKEKLGWSRPFYVRENVSKRRPRKVDIPEKTLSIIRDYNKLDSELYDYARQRFESETRSIRNFDRKVESFRSLNRAYGLYGVSGFVRDSLVSTMQGIIGRGTFSKLWKRG